VTDSPASLHIVHTESSLGWGGQELRVLTEAEAFLKRGHRVEIWAAPGSNILDDANRRGIPSRALPIARRGVRALRAVRRALAQTRPDVVNTHSSTDTWLVAAARLLLHRPPPMVRTRHISAPVSRDFATRWLYHHAARHVVTTGERLREQLLRDLRLRSARVTSVPTGVDGTRFRPGDKMTARKALGLDVDAPIVGIVATLRSWKGHLNLIDAFARLAAADSKILLVIVGDGPMREPLMERVAQHGLAARVQFAGRQEQPQQWLQAFDVFSLPSYANEGVPQAVVQAMLCGVPVVTTSVGSIGEAIVDNVSGVIVPARDVAALAAGIGRLLADRPYAERLAATARAEAERRFGVDNMAARMETIFRGVVDADRRRPRGLAARGRRLRQSLTRRWREWRLPAGYVRLGTRYGGWWIDGRALTPTPVLIDCGLGRDISFPEAFLTRFGGRVIGIDPSPASVEHCRRRCPAGMEIWDKAFWTRAGETLTFHLPRVETQLPLGADGISGSLVDSHAYVGGGERLSVTTTALGEVLARASRQECDVLKLDIEGAEYDVLADLCTRGEIARVRQLLVEFHHRATHHTSAETEATVARVERAGFRLMHVEGRNYIFRRADLD